MTTLWAETALLSSGWERDVRIEIEELQISSVEPEAAPRGKRLGIVLPAPVNAHSHAFQRAMAGLTERRGSDASDSFWTWRALMYRFLNLLDPDQIEAIAAFVQMEMLEAGYACNVEFHYLHHGPDGVPYANPSEICARIAAAAHTSGIGLTLLPVHYQFGGCDGRPLGPGQVRFGNDLEGFLRLHEGAADSLGFLPDDARIGVAAHSLRAVSVSDLQAVRQMSDSGPFHMHLAEQPAEVAEVQAALGVRPVEWVVENLAPDQGCSFIHCTQMLPDETEQLARSGAIAGLCPITESSLGDGIFDGVRWLGERGQVAIGSDSNIRISLSEELRTLEYSQRLRDGVRAALASPEKSTARRIWDAICVGGARAAGRASGSIAPGQLADLVALDAEHIHLAGRSGDTLLDSFAFAGDDRLITDVFAGGRHVVQDGHHVRRPAIEAAYRRVLMDLADAI